MLFLSILHPSFIEAQSDQQFHLRTIAFYNVENLFDIHDDPLTHDDHRTAEGKDRWTAERFKRKINSVAKVLSEIGREVSQNPADLIGLCEVENYQVLLELIGHPLLKPHNYNIIHFDSPDERGIDVALLYRQDAFIPASFQSIRLLLSDRKGRRDYTRDQLVVSGWLDDEHLYLIVNHWPSRSGGALRSQPNRVAAAKLNKHIIDSLQQLEPEAKIISMGDYNDNPTDSSFKDVLRTSAIRVSDEEDGLYNPMEKLYRQGDGSLAYRDEWSLFDQIFFTRSLLDTSFTTYAFWRARIFKPDYLVIQEGKYKGYPFRTYAGGVYSGGYSDHFPVYIQLLKRVN
ncbi:endonuclease/exonuclease/phosphatase family protein [Flavobacteriaceae bacterium R33]|uniref:Endonuclease/exonuclease/phosphatase family protein n=1 Tax=Poritiphilus flavus TaxID=2697053 RepID=A0A6L9ECV9_9FLAO|nr:endonuclease/exonuclease/phosphatase family protein [Poritiphilus flavus]